MAPSHRGFETGEAGLRLQGVDVVALAARRGTPYFLLDPARVRAAARGALTTARRLLPDAEVAYAVKANAHPAVLAAARAAGLGAEVISGQELTAALGAGFVAERIVFNGPGKRNDELADAVRHGVHIQVESAGEARALAAAAADRPARAGVRVNPGLSGDGGPSDMHTATAGSVFGVRPGAELDEVLGLLRAAGLALESLSVHLGTGLLSAEPYRRAAHLLAALAREHDASAVDLGGGFPIASEVRYPGGGIVPPAETAVPPPASVPTFADICAAIAAELPREAPPRVVLEPGRLLVSDAMHLVTSVVRVKESGGRRFVVVDAGRFQNAFFVGRGWHDIVLAVRPDAPATRPTTVVGPLCAGFDVYATERLLPELAEGDVLVVLDVGAYNLSAQSRWSFPPAPVVDLGSGELP